MRFYLVLVSFIAFCELETLSQDSRKRSLQEAFVDISKEIAKKNHLVSVVADSASQNKVNSVPFASTAHIPHVVARFKHDQKFKLNSSAIVFLDSVASLEVFNNRTILPATFSMQQQIFIHCQKGTFNEVAQIESSKASNPIIQYEYFVFQEEKLIRIFTFAWFLPGRCYRRQLVEINKFNKST